MRAQEADTLLGHCSKFEEGNHLEAENLQDSSVTDVLVDGP